MIETTSHITSSILFLRQLKLGHINAPLRIHSHQIICPYGICQGNGVASLLVSPGEDWKCSKGANSGQEKT